MKHVLERKLKLKQKQKRDEQEIVKSDVSTDPTGFSAIFGDMGGIFDVFLGDLKGIFKEKKEHLEIYFQI